MQVNNELTECTICAEKINKSVHKLVKCHYCHFSACRKCCQHYILEGTVAKCMNPECNKEWTRAFLCENLTKTFLNNEYKTKREQVLFDKEKALLPNTQRLVELEIKQEFIKKEIKELHAQIKILNNQIDEKYTEMRTITICNAIDIANEKSNDTQKKTFVRKCAFGECRGYISSQWKCNLCENYTCSNCHEVKGKTRDCPEHICNPDNVESARLIEKDSRPCPSCSSMIFKIEGCDQMFCTECKTAFSWKTGKIETGTMHNPHYFEYMAKLGEMQNQEQNQMQNGCDRNNIALIGNRNDSRAFDVAIHTAFKHIIKYELKKNDNPNWINLCVNTVVTIITTLRELNNYSLPKYAVDENENEELRKNYLKNMFDENEFKKRIQRNEKKNEKKREIHNILTMILTVANDIFIRFVHTKDVNVFKEFNSLNKYANDCIVDVNKLFDSKSKMYITPFFGLNININNTPNMQDEVFTDELLGIHKP